MKTQIFCFTALAIALTACSSTPKPNDALNLASSRFEAAQGNKQVSTLAADELKQADVALHSAKKAWADRDEASTVNHLAYMAGQRVSIAEETAANRAAQAVTAGAGAERDKTRLAMRTMEVDQAQQKLAQEQQSSAAKSAALAQEQQSNAVKSTALAQADQQLALAEQNNADMNAELVAAEDNAAQQQDQMERSDARVSDLEAQLKELNAKNTDHGMVVTLGDVLFGSGKSQILPGSEGKIAKLADFFKRNPERTALIEGYTDSLGVASANHTLSQQRATAVMNALVDRGVPANRLGTRAHGAENPVASNATAAGRQMNRRVEIVFAQTPVEISVK